MFDSYTQSNNRKLDADEVWSVGAMERRREDIKAIRQLGSRDHTFGGLRDDTTYNKHDLKAAIDIAAGRPDWTQVELWAPMFHQGGHDQHNAIAEAFEDFGTAAHWYTTYVRETGRVRLNANGDVKQIPTVEVKPEPEWILRKLKAMACYESQITIAALGCWPWFMDLKEYIAE